MTAGADSDGGHACSSCGETLEHGVGDSDAGREHRHAAEATRRKAGPHLAAGDVDGDAGTHPHQRPGADPAVFADEGAGTDVGTLADGHVARQPGAAAQRGEVADHVVVGEDDRRHHGHVGADLHARGGDDPGEHHGARPDVGGGGDGRRRDAPRWPSARVAIRGGRRSAAAR